MIRHCTILLCLVALASGAVTAQEAPPSFVPPGPMPMMPPGPGSVGPQAPHVSQIQAPDAKPWTKIRDKSGKLLVQRNPFWPVDAPPPSTTGNTTEENVKKIDLDVVDWSLAEKELKDVKIITDTKGNHLVAIRGGSIIAGIGETISVTVGSNLYTWKVRDISTKNGLKIDRQGVRPVPKLRLVKLDNTDWRNI